MFTCALDFFAGHGYFLLHFQLLSAKQKEEEGIWKKAFTTKTTNHNYYMCQA